MPETDSAPSNAEARLAGLLYLVTIICGLFAEIAVRGHFRDADASRLMAGIVREESFYRLGEAADLVMLACYIAVTALLYRLFAPAGRALALTAAGFSLIGIAVLAVAGLLHMVPVVLIGRGDMATTAQLALDLHGELYGISLFFFGIYCVLIGTLCIASGRLPRAIGLLMILGGATHVVMRLLYIAAPDILALVPRPLGMLPLIGEAALALWLLFAGLRTSPQIPSATAS